MIFNYIIDLIYPKRCAICDEIIHYNNYNGVCNKCLIKLEEINLPFCQKCGKKIRDFNNDLCDDCKEDMHVFDIGRSLYTYDGKIKKSILRYKFKNRREYAIFYANRLASKYFQLIRQLEVDSIIPVPLNKKRIKKRGYDQNYLIAKYLQTELNKRELFIPIRSDLVTRNKNTRPLKDMKPIERREHLLDAFIINDFSGRIPQNVLIIDDIYTTGATIDTLSFLLKKIGIKNIYFLCIASPYID